MAANVVAVTALPHGKSSSATSIASLKSQPIRLRRGMAILAAFALPAILGGCQLPTFGGFRGSTTQGHDEFLLWAWTFIAAIVVGAIVGLLILWSVFRYRRRSDEMPRQFQYHFGLEMAYTIIPIIIVGVLFYYTVIVENQVDAVSTNPAVNVTVTAFQWGWEFDYPSSHIEVRGVTTENPTMVVPAGEAVTITLVSSDVIHGFYVPAFNFSRYAQPGITNTFDLNVEHSGIYKGQCTQFCGLYHSLMLFQVQAVTPTQFSSWVQSEQQHPIVQNSPASESAGSTTMTASTPSPSSNATVPTASSSPSAYSIAPTPSSTAANAPTSTKAAA